jgi:monoamine oxidase
VSRANDPGVALTFATAQGSQTLAFDYAKLTLPFSVPRGVDLTAAVFDALKLTSIQAMAYRTNSKLTLQFDDRYWNGTGPWPHFITTDLPFQTTWEDLPPPLRRGVSGRDRSL